jgi:hypothetical protein
MQLYLDALITGDLKEDIRHVNNTTELECVCELHVHTFKFITTSEVLQSKHAVEYHDDLMIEQLMKLIHLK